MAQDVDALEEDELFYRRILPDKGHFKLADGELRLSSQAFSDRQLEPSVDRARLTEALGGPAFTQSDPANGVVSIAVGDVRAIRVEHQPKGEEVSTFVADLQYRPVDGNPAHYVVLLVPTSKKKSVFKKLIERLARRAEWVIKPGSVPH